MIEEWLQYLIDHAPELAGQASSSIAYQQNWRDDRIRELKARAEAAEAKLDIALRHMNRTQRETYEAALDEHDHDG